jgi:GSH-dependent disulfide-bond oxidoreductase
MSSALKTLSEFAVTARWPARHPERLQLYSLPTPNGAKVSIMLEAIGMPYEAHRVSFDGDQQKTPEFLSINPNGKILAILDPDGSGGQPLALFESGAILLCLAEKSGQMLPRDAARRHETARWLMFKMSAIGPMFDQVGFFHKFAGRQFEDKRPRDRYVEESRRLLQVLDERLADRLWIMGDEFTNADIASFPWIGNLVGFHGARELVGFDRFANVG